MFYRYYDAIFAGKDYAGEVGRVLALAGVENRGARLLEIGSGSGNHTLACARLGHHVLGVEVDPQMIALAECKRAALPPELRERIRHFHGRVEDLPEDGFDAALAMFNVVNYVATLAELETFLAAVTRRIRPGAPFVFDTWNGVAALLDPPRSKQTQVETETHLIRTAVTSRTDAMSLCTTLHYEIEAQDKRTGQHEQGTYDLRQTLWPAKIIADAANAAGLEVRGVHPLDGETRAATERDWKILFNCRRRP